MSKIPTAEKCFNNFVDFEIYPLKEYTSKQLTNDIKLAMIEFAKLHVKAALEAAAKNSDIVCKKSIGKSSSWICKRCASGGCEESIINKESILNAYPDGNIK